jgi:LysR family glycine cleavage system transcriptional activator
MSRLPLNFLYTFRSAADTQNFRATATALSLTHSAVSQQIKHLEEQLGVELFLRAKRSVALTAAGAVFLKGVESALLDIDAAATAARGVGQHAEQLVRVTVLPSFAQRWLLPRLKRWRDEHPDIPLHIDASAVLANLQREGFHAAIRSGSGHWPSLVAEPLFSERTDMVIVASPQSARRLAGCAPAQLLREPLIGDQAEWRAWFQAAGVKTERVPTVADFNDLGLMLQAVEQDLGIALAREVMAIDALAEGRLVRLSNISIPPEDQSGYHFVFPIELADWPPLMALRQWIRDEIALSLARLSNSSIPTGLQSLLLRDSVSLG